jgi:hypothetical protein
VLEPVWPRLRTLARAIGFLAGLAVIGVAVLSILQTPVIAGGAREPTRQIALELLAIVGGVMWMLLVTRV